MAKEPTPFSVFFTPTPTRCDFCSTRFPSDPGTMMYDFVTVQGVWGCGCGACWKQLRRYETLGVGRGQSYRLKIDGKFWSVDGMPQEDAE